MSCSQFVDAKEKCGSKMRKPCHIVGGTSGHGTSWGPTFHP